MKLHKKKYVLEIANNIMGKKVSKLVRYRKGYVNHNYSFFIDDVKYSMKVPQFQIVNWKAEAKVYKHFFKNIKTDVPYGIIIRPWIHGDIVRSWDVRKLESLQKQINKLRRSAIKGIPNHDWNAYNKHADMINIQDFTHFQKLVKKYAKDKKVFSHNDINGENVIWDSKRIHLIDFEWSTMNSEYFDAAAFYISSGIKLRTKNETKLDKYIFMALCYFIMWTYDIKTSHKVKKLRKKYFTLIKNKPWLL